MTWTGKLPGVARQGFTFSTTVTAFLRMLCRGHVFLTKQNTQACTDLTLTGSVTLCWTFYTIQQRKLLETLSPFTFLIAISHGWLNEGKHGSLQILDWERITSFLYSSISYMFPTDRVFRSQNDYMIKPMQNLDKSIFHLLPLPCNR